MGDDMGLGLWTMADCFDFRSTTVVQLSNRNPYFYWFRCHHPLITQLTGQSIFCILHEKRFKDCKGQGVLFSIFKGLNISTFYSLFAISLIFYLN